MSKAIIDFIGKEFLLDSNEKVKPSEELLQTGILDSMDVMRLVVFLEKNFEIKIPSIDIIRPNFQSVESMTYYLTKNHSVIL